MISEVLPYDLRVIFCRFTELAHQADTDTAAQEGWRDIQPIPQDEAPNAVAGINYEPECMALLRRAIYHIELSEERNRSACYGCIPLHRLSARKVPKGHRSH